MQFLWQQLEGILLLQWYLGIKYPHWWVHDYKYHTDKSRENGIQSNDLKGGFDHMQYEYYINADYFSTWTSYSSTGSIGKVRYDCGLEGSLNTPSTNNCKGYHWRLKFYKNHFIFLYGKLFSEEDGNVYKKKIKERVGRCYISIQDKTIQW